VARSIVAQTAARELKRAKADVATSRADERCPGQTTRLLNSQMGGLPEQDVLNDSMVAPTDERELLSRSGCRDAGRPR
jgi:hypothetical protein